VRILKRLKNRLIAKVITRYPSLANHLIAAYKPWESGAPTPWTPVTKPLGQCKVALITTAGIHHKNQKRFDMQDPHGDPTFREIDPDTIGDNFQITHDYYDHSDAVKDLNIVFPIDRFKELKNDGILGDLAKRHYSLMGHIDGPHIVTLIENSASKIITNLHADRVDLVFLTHA
jgi:D-proline reductase (dithiol) PrdB